MVEFQGISLPRVDVVTLLDSLQSVLDDLDLAAEKSVSEPWEARKLIHEARESVSMELIGLDRKARVPDVSPRVVARIEDLKSEVSEARRLNSQGAAALEESA